MRGRQRGEEAPAILAIFSLSTPLQGRSPCTALVSPLYSVGEFPYSVISDEADSFASLKGGGVGEGGRCNLIVPQMFIENLPDSIESS